MKNQNSIYRLENFGITIQKLLRLYIFTLIALLTHSCNGEASGQVINTTMFEIPSKDQKSYMLRDCRKMAGDDIDCKCAYLGRECQQADVENCRNCSCLDGSTRIFYVKKRYGAVCLSVNNIFNAAGFGEKFLIHNPTVEQCAQADINKSNIIPTKNCTFNDPRQVWVWTPGNLLTNVQTSTCLRTKETQNNRYLPMTVTRCNSLDLGQKWRCNESRLLWGRSFDSPSITHAVRYNGNKALNARSVKILVSSGNTWTVFPTNNQSVCSASHNEGSFYLSDENMEISQIDLVLPCPNNGICSKKLLTSTNIDNLSNCTILWDANFSPDSEPLVVENREDGLYFEWQSNPYTRLKGRILDMTVECVRTDTAKFEEYLFRLRVKDTTFKRVQEQYQIIQTDNGQNSSIPIVDLNKNCSRNRCLTKITVASTLNKTTAVCAIWWKESTLSRLDSTSVATENIRDVLSLRKVEETFTLEWNLRDARVLANIRFNLTILCYNDENENTTTVEKSSLVFQTKYGFIPEKRSADKTRLYMYLATTLPLTVVLLLVIALRFHFLHRKQRHRRASSETDFRENKDQNRPLILEKSAVPLNSLQPSTSDQSTQREQYEVPCVHHYEYVDKTVDKTVIAPPKRTIQK